MLTPALHQKIASPELDFAGWLYAVRRLPSNVTRTFVFVIARQIPPVFLHSGLSSKRIQARLLSRSYLLFLALPASLHRSSALLTRARCRRQAGGG